MSGRQPASPIEVRLSSNVRAGVERVCNAAKRKPINRLEPVAGCRRTCHAVPILDLRGVDGRGRSTFHHVGSGTSLTFRAVDVLPIYRGLGRGLLE